MKKNKSRIKTIKDLSMFLSKRLSEKSGVKIKNMLILEALSQYFEKNDWNTFLGLENKKEKNDREIKDSEIIKSGSYIDEAEESENFHKGINSLIKSFSLDKTKLNLEEPDKLIILDKVYHLFLEKLDITEDQKKLSADELWQELSEKIDVQEESKEIDWLNDFIEFYDDVALCFRL